MPAHRSQEDRAEVEFFGVSIEIIERKRYKLRQRHDCEDDMRLFPATLAVLMTLSGAVSAQGWNGPSEPARRSHQQNGLNPNHPVNAYGGVQIDASALLAEPSQPGAAEREPAPVNRPMFSNGWTRDGFGGRPGGWR
jgi:hypothetical protein